MAWKIRQQVPEPPQGWERLKWYGPGLIWMISSVGSGSVLFTPRVGSRYEYTLLWAALIAVLLMWVMIREVGRYTVVTGKTVLEGYYELPGPRGWAVWLIFLPQVLAAVVTIAGIAALVGSAMMIALPGSQALYATIFIVLPAILVVSGRYSGVERISSVMAIALVLVALITAVRVFPSPARFASGLVPSLPGNLDLYFILPWLGFILAGAAGVMWFSYWVAARGYGGEITGSEGTNDTVDDERCNRLKEWLRIMSVTAALGIVGGGLVIVSLFWARSSWHLKALFLKVSMWLRISPSFFLKSGGR